MSWSYCTARNRDGSSCGNKVPTRPSGVYIRGSRCRVHRIKESMDFSKINPPMCVRCDKRPPDKRTFTNLCAECAALARSPEQSS